MTERWRVRIGFGEVVVEASGWLDALALGLPELGLDLAGLGQLAVEPREDGGATARDPVTDLEIEIEPVDAAPSFLMPTPSVDAIGRVAGPDDADPFDVPMPRGLARPAPAPALAASAPAPALAASAAAPALAASAPAPALSPRAPSGAQPALVPSGADAPSWSPPPGPGAAAAPPPPPVAAAAPSPPPVAAAAPPPAPVAAAAPPPPPVAARPPVPPAAAPPPLPPGPAPVAAPPAAPPPVAPPAVAPSHAAPPPVPPPPAVAPSPAASTAPPAGLGEPEYTAETGTVVTSPPRRIGPLPDDIVEDLFLRLGEISSATGVAAASGIALRILLDLVPAGAGAVLIRTRAGDGLRFRAASGPAAGRLVDTVIPLDRGIAGFVCQLGVALSVADVRRDRRHDARVDRATGFTTKAMLAVPVRTESGASFGCIELLNPPRPFSEQDLEVAARVAGSLGAFLQSVHAAR